MFFAAKKLPGRDLWIGSMKDSANLSAARRHRIGLVVNCTKDLPFHVPTSRVRVPVHDSASDNQAFLDNLPKAVHAIHKTLGSGQGVLVHCAAGVSRSASVVAAYLMAYDGLGARQAIAAVKRAKPETFGSTFGPDRTPNFYPALQAWERMTR